MSFKRTFKAAGLFVALLATTQAVSAIPINHTFCCTHGCALVLQSNCPSGQGWSSASTCLSRCP